MDRSRWFFHPILIFILSIFALGTSLFLYIYWYIEVSAGLKSVVARFNLDTAQILTAQTWVVILVLSILVGVILLGMLTIFVYSQRMVHLYRFQRNFIDNFTHELKTPVTSLNLYLQTFQQHELTRNEQLKYIGFMLADVRRLTDNISRILNLARIEDKSYSVQLMWLNPADAIERFLAKNRYLFADARILFQQASTKTVYCRLNPTLFEILLMNIMTNAIKYNHSERPEISVTLRLRPGALQIEFKDNGNGFDKHEKKNIFKKFYQIHRTDDVSSKGSGIGLYLVKSIAKLHKGRISASSAGVGKGAVFTLTLPFPRESIPEAG
jgi:signal transduction histidine kinase